MKPITELWSCRQVEQFPKWTKHQVLKQGEYSLTLEGFAPGETVEIPIVAIASGKAIHRKGTLYLTKSMLVGVRS